MSDWKNMVLLKEGQQLKYVGSTSKGFMAETDVATYDIVDSENAKVGSVTVEDHTAVRGFKRTISIEQRDLAGRIVVQESWTA